MMLNGTAKMAAMVVMAVQSATKLMEHGSSAMGVFVQLSWKRLGLRQQALLQP